MTDIKGTNDVDVLVGTDGDDRLFGYNSNDTLEGGLGDDYLSGGRDNDTYIFNKGDGDDVIEDLGHNVYGTQDDLLKINGYSPDEVSVEKDFSENNDSSDLLLRFTGTNDRITIKYTLNSGSYDNIIEKIEFEDGTIWNIEDIKKRLLEEAATDGDDLIHGFNNSDDLVIGGEGNDTLYGNHQNDTLEGGLGDDYLSGGFDDDIYIFNKGDGDDVIEDLGHNIYGTQDDLLKINGYSPDEVSFARFETTNNDSSDLVITFTGTNDRITIKNTLNSSSYDNIIEKVEFEDGTVLGIEGIKRQILEQETTNGDDLVHGFNNSNDTRPDS